MNRAAFVLRVRPERLDDYVAAHAAVWPEMLDAIGRAGIRNYSLFLIGTAVFGYLEADDVPAAFDRLGREPINARWQDAMAELLEQPVTEHGPAMGREIFRFDGNTTGASA